MTNIRPIDNTIDNAIEALKSILASYEDDDCVASAITIITKDGTVINSTLGEWRTHAFTLLAANEINKDKLLDAIKLHMKVIEKYTEE